MSRIIELAKDYAETRHTIVLDALQAEVARVEAQIDHLLEEAHTKHDYEEAAEFYAECGPNPNSLKDWIIDIKEKLATLEAEVTRMEAELETVLKDRIALAKEVDELHAKLATLEAEKAEREKQKPVDMQFQSRDGKWCFFINEQHRQNTIADGTWPVRNLYLFAGAKE